MENQRHCADDERSPTAVRPNYGGKSDAVRRLAAPHALENVERRASRDGIECGHSGQQAREIEGNAIGGDGRHEARGIAVLNRLLRQRRISQAAALQAWPDRGLA